MSVALATAAEVADLDLDDRLLVSALAERGVQAGPAVWDDDGVDWGAHDLVVVRSTWDYATRRDAFCAWAERVAAVTALANPPEVLAWSTDKHYLADLAAAGVPVVPTAFVEPGGDGEHPHLGVEHVVKPAVSAGSRDTLRLLPGEAERSREHVRAVHASGRTAVVQPYLHGVDALGETAVVALDGVVSHAVRKGPLLRPGGGLVEALYAEEEISPRAATAAETAVAEQVLALVAARFGAPPLYARVDLLPDPGAGPLVLEVELAEPSLFLGHAPGAAGALADAVVRRLALLRAG